MKFAKLDSAIPACCRLKLRFDALDADRHLDALDGPENAHLDNQGRGKWNLWDADTGSTELLDGWQQIIELIDGFPGDLRKAHVSLLEAGQILGIHRDGIDRQDRPRQLFEMFNSTLRIHVPLRTNPQAVLYTRGRFYAMAAGECWMLHNMQYHGGVNAHPTEKRFHLILDVVPNARTMELIDEAETDLGFEDETLFDRYWPGESVR